MTKGSKNAPSAEKGDRNKVTWWGMSSSALAALVAFAASGGFILVPRPTFPHTVPLPEIHEGAAEEFERAQYQRALSVKDGSLPPSIRAVGEQFRRLGALSARAEAIPTDQLNQLRTDALELAESEEVEALLNLRALQTELFVQSLKKQQESGKANQEVLELGGAFHRTAERAWLDQDGQLKVTVNDIRVLFRARWSLLTGLESHRRFRMTLMEARRYYSINLMHPEIRRGDASSHAMAQMRFATALGQVDPTYPMSLAVGILKLRLGQPRDAARALRSFLEARPNGNWTHVARNHLMAALSQSSTLTE